MNKIKEIRGKVDFGIITVKTEEFGAVLEQFKMSDSVEGTRRYALSTLKTNQDTEYLVALVRSPHQGFSSAQQTAEELIRDLDPGWILLVGIGGGVPAHEFTLGDVVLGIRFVDFSVQAALQGKPPEFDVRGTYANPEVEDLLAYLPALKPELNGWTDSIPLPLPKVKFDADRFDCDATWQEKISKSLEYHFKTAKTRERIFWPGTIGTSNTLIKDTDLVVLVSKFARSIDAFEMEAGGVLVAARKKGHEYPVLDVRALSDIVGYKREAAWTEYACHSAASFAYHLLKTGFNDARDSGFARQLLLRKSTESKIGPVPFSALNPIFRKERMKPSDCDRVGSVLKEIEQNLHLEKKHLRQQFALRQRAIVLRERVEQFRNVCTQNTAQTNADGKQILKEVKGLLDDVLAKIQS